MRLNAFGIALATLLLVSCSDDSGDAEADIRAAAQSYSDAFLTGDSEAAFDLLSERCQERHGEAGFTAIVELAATQYGVALPFDTFAAEVNDDQARATYTFPDASINQDSEPWVMEGGEWKEDDC